MSIIEAIFLGILQGFTEFLPVSSSGHLVLLKNIMGVDTLGIAFETTVHAATVLSTIVVFRKEIISLAAGLLKFDYNDETAYICKIAVSMIPIFIVGVFFRNQVKELFGSGILIVGIFLLITSFLLFLTHFIHSGNKPLTYTNAFIIGLAQACAVIPGLSRSGATISAGLLSGVKREEAAKFSFLMVLVPILGEAILEFLSGGFSVEIGTLPILFGFIAAFVSGLIACKAMIALVKKTKLAGFAVYCTVIGIATIVMSYL